MKRILAVLLVGLTLASTASADWGHHYHGGGYNRNWWVGPAIVAGAITAYAVTRPAPVVVYQQPVYVQPSVPYGYHYEQVFDGYCNCYRNVLVPNQ